MNVYIQKDGRRDGPFTSQQTSDLIRQGKYSASDLAWHEGLSEWKSISLMQDVVNLAVPPVSVKIQTPTIATPAKEINPCDHKSAPSINTRTLSAFLADGWMIIKILLFFTVLYLCLFVIKDSKNKYLLMKLFYLIESRGRFHGE
jgi:hypothetical protein